LGKPPRLTVGVVLRAGSDRSAIGQQLAYAAVVRYLDAADAFGAEASSAADVVVTDAESLRDGMGRWRQNGVASRQFAVPVVVYDRADRLATDALPALMVPGLRLEFAVRPAEPLLPALRQAMAAGQPAEAVPMILRRLLPLAPPPLRVFIAIAVLKATSGRGVDQLARWCRMSPRTLERRLVRAGWATAHVVLQTVRALDAVWLMSEHEWPARRIQRLRKFAHASSITRLMQRHLDLTPAGIREGAGFDAALEYACDVLVHRGARPHRA
jgi:AraC-like DNA-binding protein